MKTKTNRNPNPQVLNKLGYLKHKPSPNKKQGIASFLKPSPYPTDSLNQIKARQNSSLETAAELQKCNGLLYANITKFR